MPNLAWLDSTPRWLAVLADQAGMSRRYGGIHPAVWMTSSHFSLASTWFCR